MKCEWGYCPERAVVVHTHRLDGKVIWRKHYCGGCARLDLDCSLYSRLTALTAEPIEVGK